MGSKKKSGFFDFFVVCIKKKNLTRISCIRTAACFKNGPKIYLLLKMPLFITFHGWKLK